MGRFPCNGIAGHCRRMAGGRKDRRCAPHRSDQGQSTHVIRSPFQEEGISALRSGFRRALLKETMIFNRPPLNPLPWGGDVGEPMSYSPSQRNGRGGADTEIMAIQWRQQLSLCKFRRLYASSIVEHRGCTYPRGAPGDSTERRPEATGRSNLANGPRPARHPCAIGQTGSP
jgi:hypothetical protein